MVEFALPKNSRITGGKTWPKPAGATETREFKIYRWNPDDGKNPSTDTYFIDIHDCGPMVLDGPDLDQEQHRPDADLPAASCREGVLRLLRHETSTARIRWPAPKSMHDVKDGAVKVNPLPHQPVIKDLVPDLTNFYAQYASIEPWLKTSTPTPAEGVAAEPRGPRKARRPLRMHSVRLLLDLMPELLVETASASWGPRRAAAGDALGQGFRATKPPGERLDNLEDPFRLYRCHTIMNCAKGVPEGSQSFRGHRRAQAEDGRASDLTGGSRRAEEAFSF